MSVRSQEVPQSRPCRLQSSKRERARLHQLVVDRGSAPSLPHPVDEGYGSASRCVHSLDCTASSANLPLAPPLPDPPGSSPPPPPRPPKLSYAAASSSPSTKQPNPPPRVPPKPTNLQHSPVASTNFFAASSPAQAASASTSSPAPPVPRAAKPRQPSYPQQPLELGGDGASSNGELLSTTAPAGPSTLKKRTSGAHSSPSVTRTYGSSGGGSAMRRDPSGGQDVPWANEPVPDLTGAASSSAPPRAPPVPPRAWQTPARGPAGDVGDAAAWGAQSLQQLAAAGNADSATHEVHVGPATPSPPPPPSPDARQQAQPQQHLLEWAPPPGPDLPIKRDTWWTTPRVLAGPGDMGGGKKGVWDEEVWDFVVGPTPEGEIAMKDERYPPMGAWVPLGPDRGVGEAGGNAPVVDTAADVPASSSGASEDTAMAVGDDDAAAASTSTSTADKPLPPVNLTSSSSPPPELPPKPSRGFHTVSLDDLDRARPHLNLYFCPSTFSWTLFAPIRRLSPASLLDSGPPLWHVYESCVPLELERYFAERLVEQGHLAHPQAPFAPARPDQFSAQHDARTEANGATFADACAAGGGLVELRTMDGKGSVAVGGTAFYPAVIPRALWERLMRERGDSPAVGKSADEARFEAARVIWRCVRLSRFPQPGLLFAHPGAHSDRPRASSPTQDAQQPPVRRREASPADARQAHVQVHAVRHDDVRLPSSSPILRSLQKLTRPRTLSPRLPALQQRHLRRDARLRLPRRRGRHRHPAPRRGRRARAREPLEAPAVLARGRHLARGLHQEERCVRALPSFSRSAQSSRGSVADALYMMNLQPTRASRRSARGSRSSRSSRRCRLPWAATTVRPQLSCLASHLTAHRA